jgi:hypothetical protein
MHRRHRSKIETAVRLNVADVAIFGTDAGGKPAAVSVMIESIASPVVWLGLVYTTV